MISWKTKMQTTISRSSAKVECRAIATLISKFQWLTYLLSDLGIIPPSLPIALDLYCDNQVAIPIAENLVFHKRIKQIELDCHFVRNQIQSKLISPIISAHRTRLLTF